MKDENKKIFQDISLLTSDYKRKVDDLIRRLSPEDVSEENKKMFDIGEKRKATGKAMELDRQVIELYGFAKL